MKRTDMVRKGSQMLIKAEDAIDTALHSTTELVCGLSAMRLDSDMSAVIGQEAFDALADAVALTAKARGAMVRTHAHLDEVKTRMGCGAMAGGPAQDKGGDQPVMPPSGIRRVA